MVIHIPPQLPPAYVDRDKVKQVLFNLLINAAKYSPRGGEIALSVEEAAELPADHPQGRFLLVTVRDQGIGIPPNETKRIFGRFYRTPWALTQRVKGTGLGLFIVAQTAKRHGGRAFAHSEGVGRGATFTLELPSAPGGRAFAHSDGVGRGATFTLELPSAPNSRI